MQRSGNMIGSKKHACDGRKEAAACVMLDTSETEVLTMYFGSNLQFLRKKMGSMTQEKLAE